MPLSIQGNEVLSKMWDKFRISYVEHHSGVNENDVERAFLYHILTGLVQESDAFAPYSTELQEVDDLIAKIR